MTKVGEGKELPKEPSVQKELDYNAMKFLNALNTYKSSNEEDRKRLKPIMDQCMALIKAAVSQIKRRDVANKEVEVEKDYKKYLQTGKPEDLNALEEDLSTLRDYTARMPK